MKTKLILNLTVLTLALAACGGQAPQPEPQSQPTLVIPTLTAGAPLEAPTATEPAAPATEAPAASREVSFANDVMPIFTSSCIGCHGGDQTKAALDLKTYENLMAGSFNGVVIVAGNATESVLVQQVADGEMPKRGDKLTPEQVQLISDWVAAGAPNN